MTKKVKIGKITIGGGNPVAVQSMTNTKTADIKSTVSQIKRLQEAGCEIIRCSVPDIESALAIKKIKENIKIPLVADIHYDYRLAIESLKNGADKIRINPGNIGNQERLRDVIKIAKSKDAAIRIGVNSGSLKSNINYKLKIKSKNATANQMVASLMEYVEFFENENFSNLVISLKASDVLTTIEAYRLFSKLRDYPLHIGITEAGTELGGIIKSSIGIGILLSEGLGDTIRVSLTADPEMEVYVAYRILNTLGLRRRGIDIISCPTCARTEIDVIKIAHKVEEMTKNIALPLKVAVMGCSVNGPGEASHADIGITGSKSIGVIFKRGKIIKKVKKKDLLKEFMKELNIIIKENS
ncbi:MAG: flavodoxin-dependent (E)-4-hydroxy-3-methylbut-2-enyl-diphosphate synthase [Candidatus Goldbacteria bacterium]|nr:flavodoxin-dependent (E)-4-hydroxy-3-methylbut-2-enyl-diphosphate synthase [Candidatus Goldiibacteriota bacterium]